ncbi:hypothetical protein [Paenibacillus xylanexedens]|uniref:hypothetical protein n=1 Tax=Paenibacillus xylanexedens TaxID=528191 RepID=UPI0011A1EC9F|nr:hypothetical protein [Paenibacillus xylanexedens]
MSRTRLVFSVALLLFAIIFTFNHHLGFSVGDTMLSAIGISPYTTSYLSGVHITLFLGMGFFACGFYLTRKEIVKGSPGLAKGLWIVVLAIVLSYSSMTDKFMYVAKWGASGIDGISYVQNKSSCTFNVLMTGETRATCDLTLKNYGREPVAAVLLPDLGRSYKLKDDPLLEALKSVQLRPAYIELERHGTFVGTLEFYGKAESPLHVSGKLGDIVLDVGVDGANTVFDYDIP